MANYIIGAGDPTIHPDAGAGRWNSKPWTYKMTGLKKLIIGQLGFAGLFYGFDAAAHLGHYFQNTGKDYTVALARMIKDAPSAKYLYDEEIADAMEFVEKLTVGEHQITSSRTSVGEHHPRESRNWYYASGGYSVWGKGNATIALNVSGEKSYKLDFEYKFFDRYNWDRGLSVELFGIRVTDELMGEFHRQGLAQEFNMYGSYKETVTWGGGAPTVAVPAGKNGSGR
jgi:hypothetical protein